jgi:hypothetical protein
MRLAADSAPVVVNRPRNVRTSLYYSLRIPDSSVGIATGYGLDGRLSIPGGGKFILFPIATARL